MDSITSHNDQPCESCGFLHKLRHGNCVMMLPNQTEVGK